MKKRWLSLYVENETGVLAKISGLFSGKLYNLDSLTVGVTEDPTVSRMTIGVKADDKTFEQIIKQLNRTIEVIKVMDITEMKTHHREILFVRVNNCSEQDKLELFRIAGVFSNQVIDYGKNKVIIQSVQTEEKNNDMIALLNRFFQNRIEVVRGGSVAVEALV
jgi:acetolactate synthase-1/3 small subunit